MQERFHTWDGPRRLARRVPRGPLGLRDQNALNGDGEGIAKSGRKRKRRVKKSWMLACKEGLVLLRDFEDLDSLVGGACCDPLSIVVKGYVVDYVEVRGLKGDSHFYAYSRRRNYSAQRTTNDYVCNYMKGLKRRRNNRSFRPKQDVSDLNCFDPYDRFPTPYTACITLILKPSCSHTLKAYKNASTGAYSFSGENLALTSPPLAYSRLQLVLRLAQCTVHWADSRSIRYILSLTQAALKETTLKFFLYSLHRPGRP